MQKLNYTVKDELGLHARPAGLLVKLCSGFKSDIQMSKGDKYVSAKKIFAVMGLGVKCGEEISFTVSGEDEADALRALEEFLFGNL